MGNMDDIQRTINKIQCVKKLKMLPKYGVDAIETAISAMQELQQYHDLEKKLQTIYGECDGLLVQVANELAQHGEKIQSGQPIRSKLLTDRDADMWELYKSVGTPEECREARRRQRAIPPRKAFIFEEKLAENIARMGMMNYETYRCPECNEIVAERTLMAGIYPDGFIKHKFCKGCGQKMDWGDET